MDAVEHLRVETFALTANDEEVKRLAYLDKRKSRQAVK